MNLYQISEPAEESISPKESNEIIVGIDLGTTNSIIAISEYGKCHFFKDPYNGSAIIPSVVNYKNIEAPIIGAKAIEISDTEYTIMSIKRLMGKSVNDLRHIPLNLRKFIVNENIKEGCPEILINNQSKTPVEISADILGYLKVLAETNLNKKVHKVIITVPAYFDEAARLATKDAARIAGLEVIRLLNEPTAAAVAYGFDHDEEGVFAVYDLGGGTYDISILQMQKGVFQVLAVGGDSELGGDDFDLELLKYIAEKYQFNLPDNQANLKKLLLDIRKIKELLTDNTTVTYVLFDKEITIAREELETAIEALANKTIKIFSKTLKDAGIEPSNIKEVILVGGASRIPYIKQLVTKFIGKNPLDSIDPDLSVAVGAALQAENLQRGASNLLLDVTPLSLCIELGDGTTDKIIPRNTPIPAINIKNFTTQADGQTGFVIHVLQGESEQVSECRSLAKFELKGIPNLAAGQARLELTFQIDADGLLMVKAKELSTGIAQEIQIKPSYGLTEQEILDLISNKNNK